MFSMSGPEAASDNGTWDNELFALFIDLASEDRSDNSIPIFASAELLNGKSCDGREGIVPSFGVLGHAALGVDKLDSILKVFIDPIYE